MSSSGKKDAAATEALGRAHLHDLIYTALLEQGEGLRSGDIAKALRGTVKVPNRLIKDELSADPRFVEYDRKWDLATRHKLAERPVEGALRDIVAAAGRPLSVAELVREVSSSRVRGRDSFGELVPKLLSRPAFTEIAENLHGLSDWVLDVAAGDEAVVEFQNFPDGSAELDRLRPLLESHKFAGRSAATVAKEILEAAGEPVSHKALSFIMWRARPNVFDGETLFATLLADHDLVALPGPAWGTKEGVAAVTRAAEQVAREAAEAAGPGAEEADIAGILQRRAPKGAEFRVSPSEIHQIAQRLADRGEVVQLEELMTEGFDVYPEDDAFPAAVHAVAEALDAEQSLMRVGLTRWCAVSALPAFVASVPGALAPIHFDMRDIDGEEVDPVLSDEGLEPGMADAVHDPSFEDVGEEKEVKVLVKDSKEIGECRYVLLYHHFRQGTLKVRQIDRGVIPKTPSLVQAALVYSDGGEFSVWINNDTGLIYGLEPFYSKYCPASGAVLYLAPGDAPDTYALRYDGESDAETYLDEGRINELLALGKQAEQQETSLFELMCTLMESHPQDARFNTLVAEANVVRRTARRDVASVLSAYHCFSQRKKRPDMWNYDDRKVSQGRMKQKKKFILKRR